MVQEVTGHQSNIVRRYKHASDSLRRKASKIMQGAKCCITNAKTGTGSTVKRLQCKHAKLGKSVTKGNCDGDSNSDDFLPLSQNIRTFKGSSLSQCESGVTKCTNTDDTKRVCELITSMAPKKYKKICINVEFINDSE